MTIRNAAVAALVVVALINLGQTNYRLSTLSPRYADEIVSLEERFKPVRYALMEAGYANGSAVGYLTAGIIRTGMTTPNDERVWAQTRYVMVPWNMVLATLDAPYVVIDFQGMPAQFEMPSGFVKAYESQDGLLLLVRTSS